MRPKLCPKLFGQTRLPPARCLPQGLSMSLFLKPVAPPPNPKQIHELYKASRSMFQSEFGIAHPDTPIVPPSQQSPWQLFTTQSQSLTQSPSQQLPRLASPYARPAGTPLASQPAARLPAAATPAAGPSGPHSAGTPLTPSASTPASASAPSRALSLFGGKVNLVVGSKSAAPPAAQPLARPGIDAALSGRPVASCRTETACAPASPPRPSQRKPAAVPAQRSPEGKRQRTLDEFIAACSSQAVDDGDDASDDNEALGDEGAPGTADVAATAGAGDDSADELELDDAGPSVSATVNARLQAGAAATALRNALDGYRSHVAGPQDAPSSAKRKRATEPGASATPKKKAAKAGTDSPGSALRTPSGGSGGTAGALAHKIVSALPFVRTQDEFKSVEAACAAATSLSVLLLGSTRAVSTVYGYAVGVRVAERLRSVFYMPVCDPLTGVAVSDCGVDGMQFLARLLGAHGPRKVVFNAQAMYACVPAPALARAAPMMALMPPLLQYVCVFLFAQVSLFSASLPGAQHGAGPRGSHGGRVDALARRRCR